MERTAVRKRAGGAAGSVDELASVGPAIRALRLERGLSLRDLSRLTGFSIGFLSLVERGRSSPALTSLVKIARALGVEAGSLFPPAGAAETRELPYVTRAGEAGRVAIVGRQRTYALLSGRVPGCVLEPLLVTVEPTEAVEEPYSHEGEEFVWILSGELRFLIAGREYRLGPGDSMHFRSTVRHAIHNDTGGPVQAVWVLTPRLV